MITFYTWTTDVGLVIDCLWYSLYKVTTITAIIMLTKIWNYTDDYVKICKYFWPECFYTKHLRCVYVCTHEWCSDCNHGGSDASYQLLSGFTILLSRVSCFDSLCTPFLFWHETDASSMEKNYTQSQLNIFYACQHSRKNNAPNRCVWSGATFGLILLDR